MELKVIQPTFPEVISFNYEELKQEIQKKASEYMNLVYSEDQIQDAKKDVATLRKFTKALSDERIKVKKVCLKPYEDFEAKIKELDGIVSLAIQNIDGQVKGFEEQRKAAKEQEIDSYFIEKTPYEWMSLSMIWDEKWLNASVTIKTVCAEIDARFAQIAKDLETLSNLPDLNFEAIEEYKQSLDINKAIAEGHRQSEIQKRKAEEVARIENAAIKPTPNTEVPTEDDETPRMWISFKAYLSVDDAQALKSFFKTRNIDFAAI